MEISCAFATSIDTPEHIVMAEDLGYLRAWCYDSPAVYADVWMVLALAARQTERIGLGPAVLVPNLRHPMTNAAAIATLAALAPGRVSVVVGTGFTGRVVLGQRSLPWSYAREYVLALRGLVRGETVEWEGAAVRMIHTPGVVAERPLDVPFLLGARGPKGLAVAHELSDGIMIPVPLADPSSLETLPPWRSIGTVLGTVLADDEDPTSPESADRIIDTAGPLLAGMYHSTYEKRAESVDRLPGGAEWRARIEEFPDGERHLAVHEGHLTKVVERDRDAVTAALPMATRITFTGTADDLRGRVDALEEAGYSEIVYQPAGPDIRGELERMARVLGV